LEHEVQFHHHEWWCDTPHNQETSLRGFSSENAFIVHLRQIHAGSFTESQLPFMVARAKRPSLYPFKKCPFCKTLEQDLSDVDDLYDLNGMKNRLETETKLQKHIGRHIQNFSLYAFLDPKEDEGDDNDSSTRTIAA
jgi:hypothetical protein